MKSLALLRAELHERDLEQGSERIARRHHVTLEQVLQPTHEADVVRARHAIWIWQVAELGSLKAVARLWGVDRSALLAADINAKSPIASVLLDELRAGDERYRLVWHARPVQPFAIVNVTTEETSWFPSYSAARAVWQQTLDLTGLTFRSVSNGAPVLELARGVR